MEWISVKDRLPKPFRDVLAIMDNGDMHVLYMVQDGTWNRFFAERGLKNITHWMPLPEPPKE